MRKKIRIRKTEKRASERKRELEEQGFRINIFREEPFIASRDSLQYKISLMIEEKKRKKRKSDRRIFC